MKAVILAAGRGSRLGVLGEIYPKCMLPLGKGLIIDNQCDALRRAGVHDITVVAGYKADELKAYLDGDVRVLVNENYLTTNSMYSLLLAEPYVKDDDFIVLNGDVLYSEVLIARLVQHPAPTACLVDETRPHDPCEYNVVEKDGRVCEYSKSVKQEDACGQCGQLYKIGEEHSQLYWDRMRVLEEEGKTNTFPSAAFDVLMSNRLLTPVFTNGGLWIEVDTIDDYMAGVRMFRRHHRAERSRLAQTVAPAGNGRIRGPEAGEHTVQWVVRRLRYHWRRRTLPDWLGWIAPVFAGMTRHPLKSLALAPALARDRLTASGFHLQVYGKDVMQQFLKVCREVEVTPILLWGTLLGYYRDGGLIFNDNDLDLGLNVCDFEKLLKHKQRLADAGFRVEFESEYKLTLCLPRLGNVLVDVDRIYEKAGQMVVTTERPHSSNKYSYYFAKDLFVDIVPARFLGCQVMVPRDTEAFLECVYGDWRQVDDTGYVLTGPLNLRIEMG